MNILALEFSSELRTVAVLPAATPSVRPAVASVHSSPRTLNAFQLIDSALAQAHLEREAIDCVTVGLGPGSYTGIRAAISIAQAWELARNVKLLGIGSVECLAAQAEATGMRGRISFVVDAQRNEVYLAAYEIEPSGRKLVESLRLAPIAEVLTRAKAGEVLAGPEVDRWVAGQQVLFPDAGTLASLAVDRKDFVTGEMLEPIYLREPVL